MRLTRALPAFLCLVALTSARADDAHEPAKGSAERKALMDAIRASDFQKGDVVFQVIYLRVHHGWAWADVSPLDRATSKPVAEGGTVLLHQTGSGWKTVDLSKIPDDPQNPEGRMEASPGFIKNLRKVHPDIPLDIFPAKKK
jgi:hypothetical protein